MSALPDLTTPSGHHGASTLRVLVIDDAPEHRMLLEPLLAREGFEVVSASDAETGIALTRSFLPDVILLDLVLPGLDGLEACRQIRTFSDAYIVMITAKDAELDRVVGLTIGADDYVPKPFSPAELVARVRALLRRPRASRADAQPAPPGPSMAKAVGQVAAMGVLAGQVTGGAAGSTAAPTSSTVAVPAASSVSHYGELAIDLGAREVWFAGSPVELTRIEFDLLATLCGRPRMVFSRTQLLELVWGPNWYGDTHVVDVHMSNVRRKLAGVGSETRIIDTVRGVGFRLNLERTG